MKNIKNKYSSIDYNITVKKSNNDLARDEKKFLKNKTFRGVELV